MKPAVSVPLGHGIFALVDAADARRVLAQRWVMRREHDGRLAAMARLGGRRGAAWVRLHRFVVDAPVGSVVMPRSGDFLDARRANLVVASRRDLPKLKRSPLPKPREPRSLASVAACRCVAPLALFA